MRKLAYRIFTNTDEIHEGYTLAWKNETISDLRKEGVGIIAVKEVLLPMDNETRELIRTPWTRKPKAVLREQYQGKLNAVVA